MPDGKDDEAAELLEQKHKRKLELGKWPHLGIPELDFSSSVRRCLFPVFNLLVLSFSIFLLLPKK